MKSCMDNIVRMLGTTEQQALPMHLPKDGVWTDEHSIPFGKHVGTKLKDLPTDYRDWLISEGASIKHEGIRKWALNKTKEATALISAEPETTNQYKDDVPF